MTQMTTPARHVPVLAQRCLDLLAPAVETGGAVLIDATLGLGGHAEAALRRFDQLHMVGIDRDPQALALATERLAPFADRFPAVHARYDVIGTGAAEHGRHGRVQDILFDLVVCSLQLDESARGLSKAQEATLDMRIDATTRSTAAELRAEADE